MHDLITSFLIQAKECSLPGIGKISISTKPAELDIANKQMLPPSDEIIFTTRPDKNIDELAKYVSFKKNLSQTEALDSIKSWCNEIKEKLNEGGQINFGSIGDLRKNTSGNIYFTPARIATLLIPVTAERVIHKNSDHAVLVGDKETTSSAMNQFLNEEEAVKSLTWKIIALVLFVIAVTILLFHFYSNSSSVTGNQSRHVPSTPGSTYSTP